MIDVKCYQNENGRRVAGRWLAHCALFALTLASAERAQASPQNSGFGFGGGDAVGTLPSMGPGGGTATVPPSLAGDERPAAARLVLVGPLEQLRLVVRSFEGPLELSSVANGSLVRVRFAGGALVELDRQALLESTVQARLEVEPGFLGAAGRVAAVLSSGPRVLPLAMHAGGVDLRLHKLVGSGLTARGVTLEARAHVAGALPSARRIRLAIFESGASLFLQQGN
jgi:hypothetical protein